MSGYHRLGFIASIFLVLCAMITPSTADTLLSEDFSGGFPGTWETADFIYSGILWSTSDDIHPSWVLISGEHAYVEADNFDLADASMATPVIDCSNFTNMALAFDHRFRAEYHGGPPAAAGVYIKIGSAGWEELFNYDSTQDEETVWTDLSAAADGESEVRLGWRFRHASYGDSGYWAVDNVFIAGDPVTTSVPTTTTTTTQPADDDSADDTSPDDTADDDADDTSADDTDDDATDDAADDATDDASDDTSGDDDDVAAGGDDDDSGGGGSCCG